MGPLRAFARQLDSHASLCLTVIHPEMLVSRWDRHQKAPPEGLTQGKVLERVDAAVSVAQADGKVVHREESDAWLLDP